MSPTAFINLLLPIAKSCQREYGVPVSISIGQAALESGWGAKAPGNNLFGVKADSSWTGPVINFVTTEYVKGVKTIRTDKFRAYASIDESVHDHARFLRQNGRYTPCFKETTAAGWANALQAAGYASDPNYAKSLFDVIKGRDLAIYDK